MKISIAPAFLGGLTLLLSTSVSAHIGHTDGGVSGNLVHLMTGGHHAPVVILACVGIVYLVRKNLSEDK